MDGSEADGALSSEIADASQGRVPGDDAVVELHHAAGLTAGRTLRLRPGTFSLGRPTSSEGELTIDAPSSVSFVLQIEADGRVTLTPGDEPVAVEGIVADGDVHLDDGDVIQLRTDHYVLRAVESVPRHRSDEPLTPQSVLTPTSSPYSPWLWFFSALVVIGLVAGLARPSFFGLALIGVGGIVATFVLRDREQDQQRREHARLLDNSRSLLFQQVVDRRKLVAAQLRADAPTPLAIADQAAATPRAVGENLRVSLASGDRSWAPPVVCHREPGWDHRAVVEELSFLPAVPFTVDLEVAPIAIVGERRPVLAIARHLATSALVMSPSDTGVSVDTSIPADWRWLQARANPTLTILDGVSGAWRSRTVVLASAIADLSAVGDVARFSHVMQIEADGSATILQPDGSVGSGLIPHGITETTARQLHHTVRSESNTLDLRNEQPLLDLTGDHDVFSSSRLLVTGPDRSRTKKLLATAALRQAASQPDRSIFILDRGDRALIRLAQLRSCRRYAAIDQIADVEQMVSDLTGLERHPGGPGILLLAPDLWSAVAFYRNSGRPDLADQIDQLVDRWEILPMAASSPDRDDPPPSAFLVWIDASTEPAAVHHLDRYEEEPARVIDLEPLQGSDLTGSVAHLISPRSEEPIA